MIGEVNKSVFSKTSIIKRITGDDLIRIEYKGKDSFDTHLYCKPLISCNILPETTDTSIGFYRRWFIINFPNQFDEKQNILKKIPEEEFENLGLKCISLLKNLLKSGTFHNEGTIPERQEKYEKYSNPMDKFLEEFTSKNPDGWIIYENFYKRYVDHLISLRFRKQTKIEISRGLKKRGYEIKIKNISSEHLDGYVQKTSILGVSWK